jgi:hypothetical protein
MTPNHTTEMHVWSFHDGQFSMTWIKVRETPMESRRLEEMRWSTCELRNPYSLKTKAGCRFFGRRNFSILKIWAGP